MTGMKDKGEIADQVRNDNKQNNDNKKRNDSELIVWQGKIRMGRDEKE